MGSVTDTCRSSENINVQSQARRIVIVEIKLITFQKDLQYNNKGTLIDISENDANQVQNNQEYRPSHPQQEQQNNQVLIQINQQMIFDDGTASLYLNNQNQVYNLSGVQERSNVRSQGNSSYVAQLNSHVNQIIQVVDIPPQENLEFQNNVVIWLQGENGQQISQLPLTNYSSQ